METTTDAAPYREVTRRTLHLGLWMLGWLATLAAAQFGPEIWISPIASWVAIAVNLAVGVCLIIAFTRYLRAIDDLERKIMLDALAITLGLGWVGGFGWIVADAAGLVSSDIAAGVFPAALGVIFAIATIVGRIRYR